METIIQALTNIGFDWRVALANLINFLIVFWLLKKFLFSKLQIVLVDRRERIQKGLDDARKAETELAMAEEQKERILDAAKQAANEIIAEARQVEKEIVSQATKKAQSEAHAMISRAEVQIEEKRSVMEKEIRSQTATMIVEGVKKVLQEEIDEERGAKLIERSIGKVA
jgi:F-type H+-transporting ATPase subunit b